MAGRRGRSAARKNELGKRGKVRVERIQLGFQAIRVRLGDLAVTGNTEFGAQIEQIVLNLGQAGAHRGGHRRHGEHHANRAVQFVDRAIGLDAQAVLGYPGTVAEPGATLVAGARINLAQSITHGEFAPFRGCDGRRVASPLSRQAR